MSRYFIELSYTGTNYSGFQIQQNARTIQAEVEHALQVIFREKFALSVSSRTDSGVHAYQNYFHFDSNITISNEHIYNLNSILPADIAIRNIFPVNPTAHCRFDAIGRSYTYTIYQHKNPFLSDRAYYYPYPLQLEMLNRLAAILYDYNDYTSFSKKRTQVKSFICTIKNSEWQMHDEKILYNVSANRFLRGMVRGLVGTMLSVIKNDNAEESFRKIIESQDCRLADFSSPAKGLCLMSITFKAGILYQ